MKRSKRIDYKILNSTGEKVNKPSVIDSGSERSEKSNAESLRESVSNESVQDASDLLLTEVTELSTRLSSVSINESSPQQVLTVNENSIQSNQALNHSWFQETQTYNEHLNQQDQVIDNDSINQLNTFDYSIIDKQVHNKYFVSESALLSETSNQETQSSDYIIQAISTTSQEAFY